MKPHRTHVCDVHAVFLRVVQEIAGVKIAVKNVIPVHPGYQLADVPIKPKRSAVPPGYPHLSLRKASAQRQITELLHEMTGKGSFHFRQLILQGRE